MDIEIHGIILVLDFLCQLQPLYQIFLLHSIAFGEDNLEITAQRLKHIKDQRIGFF